MMTTVVLKVDELAQIAAATNEVESVTETLLRTRDLETNATEGDVVGFGQGNRLLRRPRSPTHADPDPVLIS